MKWTAYGLLAACVIAACLWVPLHSAHAADVPRITKEELKGKLCSKDLILLDVRVAGSWQNSKQKIKCAQRVDPDNVSAWADTLPKDKEIVLYCS